MKFVWTCSLYRVRADADAEVGTPKVESPTGAWCKSVGGQTPGCASPITVVTVVRYDDTDTQMTLTHSGHCGFDTWCDEACVLCLVCR